ncbi:SDR family NAD(P)-dependent oxidoreductase [Fluviicola sp.]|uniref:SDR family NAD(P)-dependent oxidoreductase n=1 Tax=Fluviicola sp. TaxID=1917219 RepID=UPI002603B5E7|nr:SDR family NAD(P)-dependent oxidoreductase [Fluviicola sp.]
METTNYQGALQKPIGSGFNATSTASEVIQGIDLTGKIAVITGGNVGIGLQTTRVFSEAGATVIVLARDVEKAMKNLNGIPNVRVESMDLMNPASIDAFAQAFISSGSPLHFLINNAGIMWVPYRTDSRGFESQLATNHLGHFQLTARLWPALKAAHGARVVNVSSFGHHYSPFHFEDPNFERRAYETLLGYGQSKTAINLFTVELDNLAKAFQVRAYAVHPGSVGGTDLAREASPDLFKQMGILGDDGTIRPEVAATLKTIEQGAATTVWCATSPELNQLGGVYCEDADIAVLDLANDAASYKGVLSDSLEENNAKKLWKLSEAMTQVSFEIKSYF